MFIDQHMKIKAEEVRAKVKAIEKETGRYVGMCYLCRGDVEVELYNVEFTDPYVILWKGDRLPTLCHHKPYMKLMPINEDHVPEHLRAAYLRWLWENIDLQPKNVNTYKVCVDMPYALKQAIGAIPPPA